MKSRVVIVLAVFVASLFSLGTAAAQETRPGSPKAIPGELEPVMPSEREAYAPETGQIDFRAAHNLVGMPILNEHGQRIGEVDRVLIDMERGQIAYLVGNRTAATGLTGERFVVPWAAMETSPERSGLVVTSPADLRPATPETLSRIDRETGMEIHQHYGVSPYWE